MRPQAPWSVHWLQHATHLTAAAPLLLIEHKLKHSGCANKFVPSLILPLCSPCVRLGSPGSRQRIGQLPYSFQTNTGLCSRPAAM